MIGGRRGDGKGHDGCSDDASAAGGGVGRGREDAGVFTAQFEQGEEIWLVGAAVCHGDKKIHHTK